MRLVKIADEGELVIAQFFDNDIPPYAILSHTWGATEDEVGLQDLVEGTGKDKPGYAKIQFAQERASASGLRFFWLDTCCIDRTSSAELSEAMNSMFTWYRNASVCLVYLSDVTVINSRQKRTWDTAFDELDTAENDWKEAFYSSRWFTRSWTLQELLAPSLVEFFSRDGDRLGSKATLLDEIHEITQIPIDALQGRSLSTFSVQERMSWARQRVSKRAEDVAYSLLGIFDVSMPLIYGEGAKRAFFRLRREIEDSMKFPQESEEPIYPQSTMGTEQTFTPRTIAEQQLSNASPRSNKNLEEGMGIKRLQSPQVLLYAQPLSDSTFRCLTLEPGTMGAMLQAQLEMVDITDHPPYSALSYVWGQEPEIHRIMVNNTPVFIQPNLFHALQRIRLRSGPIRLWVDSLCINQADISERNAQVKRLASIFRAAEATLIWLGEQNSTSTFAMDFIHEVINMEFSWEGPWWEHYGVTALGRVLERPWFRRAWVFQEAAFSKNSTIWCGDRQVHMDHLALAVNTIRARMMGLAPHLDTQRRVNPIEELLAPFQDSPATKLLDIVDRAFKKSEDGEIVSHKLSLENLVVLTTSSETTDDRDTIYALLNLANDVNAATPTSQTQSQKTIVPNYRSDLLELYADFISHCCSQSGSLDILCRPWAPKPSSVRHSLRGISRGGHLLPSWITTRDQLPFGEPSRQSHNRLHAKPLAGDSHKRTYSANHNMLPKMHIQRDELTGNCWGSLLVTGFILGTIKQRSPRMASAMVSKECLNILGTVTKSKHTGLINLPDPVWRTLCADRDDRGDPAPNTYRSAMLYLLQSGSNGPGANDDYTGDAPVIHVSAFDVEELLESNQPFYVTTFLETVLQTVWNRRTFRGESLNNDGDPLIGLAPKDAKVDDYLCIIYGCSVPLVLRKVQQDDDTHHWQLIGEAYVYGHMDGEAIRQVSPEQLSSMECEFDIR